MHERHVRFGTVLDTTAAVLTSACGRYVGVWKLRRHGRYVYRHGR